MDRMEATLSDITLIVYLDDVIIFSTHIRELQRVFTKFNKLRLKTNKEKSHFCCAKVKYLGHILTKDGITADLEKTTPIESLPTSRNIKQTLSVLKTCSRYRSFVPHFVKKKSTTKLK